MKKLLLTLILATTFLTILSCEKDENEDPAVKATREKLEGRWRIDSLAVAEYHVDEILKKTYPGTSADYVEFLADGTMNTRFRGRLDVAHYTVQSETEILVDKTDVTLREFTDKKLVFFFKNSNGVVGYTEQTYYLRR
jgi:hypothetical protein